MTAFYCDLPNEPQHVEFLANLVARRYELVVLLDDLRHDVCSICGVSGCECTDDEILNAPLFVDGGEDLS